jgi:hypothetical protein
MPLNRLLQLVPFGTVTTEVDQDLFAYIDIMGRTGSSWAMIYTVIRKETGLGTGLPFLETAESLLQGPFAETMEGKAT